MSTEEVKNECPDKDASAEANSDPSPTMNAKTSELSNKLF